MLVKQRQHSLPGYDLDRYVNESINFLRQYEPLEGYFIGFSGGKDSIVTLELCRMAGVKHDAYFTHAGIEPPELLKFIRAHYPQVRWLRPAKSFFAFVQTNAPPLRMQRWCCEHIKERPSWNVPLDVRLFGVRAEESARRAQRGRINPRKIAGGRTLTALHPIFAWPEWAVWEFIEAHGLPYPSLYDEGLHRLGCVVCPFIFSSAPGAQRQQLISKARWPGIWKAFRHACHRWWLKKKEQGRGRTEESFEDWWQSYLRGFEK